MQTAKINLEELLQEINFSEVEALTYQALLNLESVSIRKVAAATGINRGTTYEAIRQLVVEGLVSTRKVGEREYYSAESPEKIYDLIRDKRKDLWTSQQQAQVLIPELLAQKARPLGQPLVKYYEDDDGVVAVLRDVLQTCSKLSHPRYYVYSSRPLRHYIYRKFPKFTERRIRDGISVQVIAVGEGGDPAANAERKWMAEPEPGSVSSYTIIYGNKMAVISISNDYTPYAVVIEDAGTASMQRLLFEQLWSSL